MKIVSIQTFALKIPGKPYMGGHDLRRQSGSYGEDYIFHERYRGLYTGDTHALLVKITTDNGLSGWGETQCVLTPEIVAQYVHTLVAPGLLGKNPHNVAVIRDFLYDQFRDRGHDSGPILDAIAACDIALWDIRGKDTGLPVYQLLGGSYHDPVPCYVSGVPAITPEEQAEKILQWKEKGFRAFKLSLGFGVRQDVEHMTRLREAVGPDVDLLTDIHWVYNLNDSIRLGRAFESLNIAFIECPMNAEVIERHTQLCAALDMPVALGEEFRTRYRFKERLEATALDLAQPDIGRMGITEGMRAVELCSAYDVPVAPHCGSGLAIYVAASLHIAAASRDLFYLEFQPTQLDLCDRYFTPSFQPQEGTFVLPTEPGLGIEPDEEALKKVAYPGHEFAITSA